MQQQQQHKRLPKEQVHLEGKRVLNEALRLTLEMSKLIAGSFVKLWKNE
jgi:hypothetical protein